MVDELPNQCLRCGGPISWSRWFCNLCAEDEGLTVALGMAPSKPKRFELDEDMRKRLADAARKRRTTPVPDLRLGRPQRRFGEQP